MKSVFISFKEKGRLIKSFFSLLSLNLISGILSLITLPYLVRVLGPEKFGLVIFAQVFIQYFITFIEYGFNLSAAKEVSVYREKREKLSEILSSVVVIKFFLSLICFLILLLILIFFPKFKKDALLYFLSFGMVITNIILPFWFFVGIEKMKYLPFLNLIAKLIFIFGMLLLIKEKSDYLFVPVLNFLGYLTSGVVGLTILFKKFKIHFTLPSVKTIKHHLKMGGYVFSSVIGKNIKKASTIFILGLFTTPKVVGYYGVVEKIIMGINRFISIFFQTTYPFLTKLITLSKKRALIFLKKFTIVIGIITFLTSLFLFVFAKQIILIFFGPQYQSSILILRILAFLPLVGTLGNIFISHGLTAFGFQKILPKFMIPLSIFHLFLLILLVPYWSLIGASTSLLITELLIFLFAIKYFLGFINNKNNRKI